MMLRYLNPILYLKILLLPEDVNLMVMVIGK